ncbi:MAG: hypothetical protein HOE35_04440 [Candidatus Ruthia sp.]|jgi:hypothetical protein|nr:hypothetical protein [Candidatus Ruthturnera sp.]MBT4176768.1 hypothetical protein [Candidatus Neomarinimicrobiota bacterium]MBT6757687.1 hypothetical protein [Candidatus Jacksonbacteria bacterium]
MNQDQIATAIWQFKIKTKNDSLDDVSIGSRSGLNHCVLVYITDSNTITENHKRPKKPTTIFGSKIWLKINIQINPPKNETERIFFRDSSES